jgi:hypothetical protein
MSPTPRTRRKGGTIHAKNVQLSDAQAIIAGINQRLAQRCPDLSIQIGTVATIESSTKTATQYTMVRGSITRNRSAKILLCLNKSGMCISSIEIYPMPYEDFININSRTATSEEGKKYNKLLRTVLVLIAGSIRGVRRIHSIAVNPISAWLLINNYQVDINRDTHNAEFLAFLEENHSASPISISILGEYYATHSQPMVSIYVPLTEYNRSQANMQLHTLIRTDVQTGIIC